MSNMRKLNGKMKILKLTKDEKKPPPPSVKLKIEDDSSQQSVVEDEDQLAADLQYKTEVLWCIGYMRDLLDKPKVQLKQDALLKAYKVLLNEKATKIAKRQAMDKHCGNYRKAMALEAVKVNSQPNSQAKMVDMAVIKEQSTAGELKGTFVKRKQATKQRVDTESQASTQDFKFDF